GRHEPGQEHQQEKGEEGTHYLISGVVLRPWSVAGSPRTTDYLTTLTLNFTSCVVGTLPLTIAVARTTRSLRAPGAAAASAFSTSLASSWPGGTVTSAALTPWAFGGSTSCTLNSPA